LSALGAVGAVEAAERPGHAAEVARAAVAGGAGVVCAWGGDGTVNEVARALVGAPVALAIVPAGSGNGLARELAIPRDPARALAVAVTGRERLIDVGEIDGRLFVNVAGLGLDAVVAARFNARPGGRRGLWPYLALALRELLRDRPREYAIRLDRAPPFRAAARLVVCANGRQYGGGAVIAPAARVDDGRLDLVLIGPGPRLAALARAPRLFLGGVARSPGVRLSTFAAAEIAADAPIAFHADGECFTGGPVVSVRVRPGALRVRVP
jgi:YegS/Rv2252/BmrU family lipid kinase